MKQDKDKGRIPISIFNKIDKAYNVYDTVDVNKSSYQIPLKPTVKQKFNNRRVSCNQLYQNAFSNATDSKTLSATLQLDELKNVKNNYEKQTKDVER